MIATIIIVSLALAWLLAETDFMRVRLPASGTNPESRLKVDSENSTLNKPSQFEALAMPETTGNLQIICMRE